MGTLKVRGKKVCMDRRLAKHANLNRTSIKML